MGILQQLFSLLGLQHEQNVQQQQELMQQQQENLSNPYMTPGVDVVVDESYHGIDHGMGIANPPDNDFFNDSGMGSGFGGFDGM